MLRNVVFRPAGSMVFPGGDDMDVKTGVYTATEVNMPVNGGAPQKWLDASAPSTWSTAFFLAALVFLIKVL